MSLAERHVAESRADQILDRITGTFARKGLEGSSMQDLAAAAGMSVGNFYRYYPSKVALIAALVERCVGDIRQDFDRARAASEPFEAMRDILHDNLLGMSDEEAALWLQIDAAAVVHPEIAAVKSEMDASIRANVRSMLRSFPFCAAAPDAVLDDMTDFLLIFCSSLFRQRAFEGGEAFDRKVRRLTAHLFAMVRNELAAEPADGVAPVHLARQAG